MSRKVSETSSTKFDELPKKLTEELLPQKAFFTLKEACNLKGLNYKTACNKKHLQPNGGKEDGHVGGRKVFSRLTIIEWLFKTDEDISTERGKEDV